MLETCKRCSRCGQWKPYTEFHRRARSHDGHQSCCKPCQIRFVMATRDPIKHKACVRRYNARHAERLARKRVLYYRRHRAKVIAYSRWYYRMHRDAVNARQRRWYLNHRDYVKAYHRANKHRWRERINAAARRRYHARKSGSAPARSPRNQD